ncbi:MAG TPA: restriction endonuclease [Tepidisphaeraceae bacterium]|nr:restriction endonuclease [Tepidisphaeraceae bacterium]
MMHLVEHIKRSLNDAQRVRLDETIDHLYKALTYREREILKLLYGWGDGYTYTHAECGSIFKLSEKQIIDIEAKILQKFAHQVHFQKLKPFIAIYPFSRPQNTVIEAMRLCDSEIMKFVSRHPHELHKVGSRQFEEIIAEVLRGFGFDVELTQQTRDGGHDIVAFSTDKLSIKTKYIVECKRYAPENPVRVELVRSLYAVQQQQRAHHALLATTSFFTPDAAKFARDPAVFNLHLKDFNALQSWLKAYAAGLKNGAILL